MWQLPDNKVAKTVPVTHRFLLKYQVEVTDGLPAMLKSPALRNKVYVFQDELSFAVDKVGTSVGVPPLKCKFAG